MSLVAICQGLLVAGWAVRTLGNMYTSVNGRAAMPPIGFTGIIIDIMWSVGSALVLYKAGALSVIFGPQ